MIKPNRFKTRLTKCLFCVKASVKARLSMFYSVKNHLYKMKKNYAPSLKMIIENHGRILDKVTSSLKGFFGRERLRHFTLAERDLERGKTWSKHYFA
jgi:hypothetical protein